MDSRLDKLLSCALQVFNYSRSFYVIDTMMKILTGLAIILRLSILLYHLLVV